MLYINTYMHSMLHRDIFMCTCMCMQACSYIYLCVYVCVWVCVCVCTHTCVVTPMWKPEGDFWVLILSFHHVCPQDWAQVVRPGGKHVYLLGHLTCPSTISYGAHPHILYVIRSKLWAHGERKVSFAWESAGSLYQLRVNSSNSWQLGSKPFSFPSYRSLTF